MRCCCTPGLRRRGGRAVAAALSLAGFLAVGLVAREGPAAAPLAPSAPQPLPTTAPRAHLVFVAAAHARTGPMDASRASTSVALAPGEHGRVAFTVGTPARPNLCAVGTGDPATAGEGFVTWSADVVVRQAEAEVLVFDLVWQRAGGAGLAGDTRTVRLRHGQAHLLDVVTADAANPTRCSAVSFQVTATLAPPPGDALLAHRLWLVIERDGQRLVSGPVEVIGAPGEPVGFRLRPLRWPLVEPSTTGAALPVDLEVEGRLTATTTGTGGVEATLHVARRVHLGGWTGGRGTLPIRGRLGEAVTVALPPPAGVALARAGSAAPGAELPYGVTRAGPDLRVTLGDYFAASTTTLVIITEQLR